MSCLFFSSENKYNMSCNSKYIKSGRSFKNFSLSVGHIWKFDLEEYELRNFEKNFNFSKIRIEPVMLNFLAKTENLRNRRSEHLIYNRGKVLEKTAGNCYSQFPDTK